MTPKLSLHLVPVVPAWAVLVLAAALLAVLFHGSVTLLRRQVPPRWVGILGALRIAIIVLFALVLLQPVLSYTRTSERRADMLVLLDTSESMDQPGGTEGASRLEEVVRSLDDSGLAAELGRRFDLRWFACDRGAAPLEGTEWAGVQATGPGTHLADSLTQAWSYPRDAASATAPERVLLVSDGLDRGNLDLVEVAQRLGVAVDVLAPGSPPVNTAPPPVTIADVQGARRVLLGSETHFLVTLRTGRAAGDRKVTLRLSEGGKELETTEVVLRAGRTEERVRLAHRPAEAGPKRYEFRAGDASPLYPLSVQVVDGKHEVLVLEDTWRWEFKFLRRVLEEDPSFRFTALLSRGGGAFMQFAAPDRRSQLVGFPQNPTQLSAFDTVVVGDVNPRRWPREFAAMLRRLVADEGKSLVVLAGPNVAQWVETPELLALLPVEITRETGNPVVGPVLVRISPEGARSPFFLQPGAGASTTALPALDQIYPPLRKKPGATVLLEAARLGNANGPLILMAEHTVGRGRVLYVGTDTLWKWQTLTTAADANTTPYHLFWQQTLRALAPLRPGGAGVSLWLQPRRSRYEAGGRAAVRAEVESAVPLPQASVQGVVSLPDGRSLPLSFAADPAAPNGYVAEFETGPAGAYRLTAQVVSEGRTAAEGTAVLDVDEPRPERDGAPVDMANLARIAAATGGKVVDPADPQTWPASAASRAAVTERRTVDLWNRSYLLLLLAGIAGSDWLLRLLRGYV
jgi:hypothetical protein